MPAQQLGMSANSSPTDPGAGFTDLLLWPWRVGKALALLPVSFQLHEGQPRAGGTAQHQQLVPTALGPLHDKLRAALGPNEYVLVVPRALHSWQAGQQIFSHALAYNAVEAGVKLLHLQPAAERLMAAGHSLLQGATGQALLPAGPAPSSNTVSTSACTPSLGRSTCLLHPPAYATEWSHHVMLHLQQRITSAMACRVPGLQPAHSPHLPHERLRCHFLPAGAVRSPGAPQTSAYARFHSRWFRKHIPVQASCAACIPRLQPGNLLYAWHKGLLPHRYPRGALREAP